VPKVVGFGRRFREHDLLGRARVQEAPRLLARAFEALGRRIGHEVKPAVDVRVGRLHGAHHGIDDGARLLRRRGVVEIDERLAVDLL
jgi:hypothetical protein